MFGRGYVYFLRGLAPKAPPPYLHQCPPPRATQKISIPPFGEHYSPL